MGFGWDDAIMTGLGLLSTSASSSAANRAAEQQQQQLGQSQDWMNKMWGYEEPWAQYGQTALAGLSPVQQQAIGWLASMSGVSPGTSIGLPTQPNVAIPEYLRQYANAAPGTWQNELYRRALYNNTPQSGINDIIKDIGHGEDPMRRLQRSSLTSPPSDWQVPTTTTGGQSITVPGQAELPPWLQTPAIDTRLSTALTDLSTIDWRNPYTAEQLTQMMEPTELSQNQLASQMSGALSSNLARRGMGGAGTSSIGAMPVTGEIGWLAQARAQNKANALNLVQQRGDQLRTENIANLLSLEGLGTQKRGEQQTNWQNILAMLTGAGTTGLNAATSGTTAMSNNAQNNANTYGDMAKMYGGMASQSAAGLGNYLAIWLANQNNNKSTSVVGTGGGTTGGGSSNLVFKPLTPWGR